MLHLPTIDPSTLELLRKLQDISGLCNTRLVGGTAGLKDISAMKITAVIGRGTRKDFIDIAFLLKYFSLQEILGFYTLKYPEASPFLALKSLAYFDDADKEIHPFMLETLTWEDTKQTINKHLAEI